MLKLNNTHMIDELSKYNAKSKIPYWGQILKDAPEGLGGEEWGLARKELEKEMQQKLIDLKICPDCSTHLIEDRGALICNGCGLTATTTGER